MKVNYINVTSNNVVPELELILIKNSKFSHIRVLLVSYMGKYKIADNKRKLYKETKTFLQSLLDSDDVFINFLYTHIDTHIKNGKIINETFNCNYSVYDIHEYKDFFVDSYRTNRLHEMIKKERIDRINKLLDI